MTIELKQLALLTDFVPQSRHLNDTVKADVQPIVNG